MVVNDLNIVGIAIPPAEADPPLIVHTDTVLTHSASAESFQPIPRRHAKVVKHSGRIQHPELPERDPLNVRSESLDPLSVEQSLSIPVAEAPDHAT